MKKAEKTNVMRILDQRGVSYTSHDYSSTDAISGAEVATALGQDPARVFKTLVTVGKTGRNYVFVIPVLKELELKKAAAAAGEKSIAMLKAKDLLPLTGYVHGGCSPIGMKKPFPTFLDQSAAAFDTVLFSAGKIGWQVETAPDALHSIVAFEYADLCADA